MVKAGLEKCSIKIGRDLPTTRRILRDIVRFRRIARVYAMSSMVILALMIVSCARSASLTSKDRENEMLASSLRTSSNEVSFGINELAKFSRKTNDDADSEKMSKNNDDDDDDDDDDDNEQIVHASSFIGDRRARMISKKGRKRKNYYNNYPQASRINRKQTAVQSYVKNLQNYDNTEVRKKLSNGKRYQQESQIYYIKLPPTPYTYVPGFGYISQPPTYSSPGIQRPASNNYPHRPTRPRPNNQKPNSPNDNNKFIKVPVDFVSNGKPTGVYQWPAKRRDTNVNRLDDGPYVFNGRPTSLYLLKSDGRKTGHQPIRLEDSSNDSYYY